VPWSPEAAGTGAIAVGRQRLLRDDPSRWALMDADHRLLPVFDAQGTIFGTAAGPGTRSAHLLIGRNIAGGFAGRFVGGPQR
jgi:hypothetical protein